MSWAGSRGGPDDRLQFNGAVFLEEWDNIQVAFQGLNGITQVENGPEAEIKGTEMQLDWLATDNCGCRSRQRITIRS